MDSFTPDEHAIPLSLPCVQGPAHARLHGQLSLHPAAPGLVVLAYAAPALDAREHVLAGILRHAGLSTLAIDLIAREEEHYPDLHNNVPLLARRLVDVLDLIKTRMLMGELQTLPFGLCAAHATSPVAVRVAALRDHDIAAVVCRGGLIDLAGLLYLRTLEAPLLQLVEENDAAQLAAARRAQKELQALSTVRAIPEIGFEIAGSAGFEAAARETTQWFCKHFARHASSTAKR
ncbi:MAG: hypothetical protein QMB55_07660 [Propionivibrio sp.]